MAYVVWIHPKKGDDYYHAFKSKEKAKAFYRKAVKSKRFAMVEKPRKTKRQ